MTRDEWTAAFVDAVLRANLGFSGFSHRYLSTVALQQAECTPPALSRSRVIAIDGFTCQIQGGKAT